MLKISDFDGLGNLPKTPSRIVFGTNSMNYDENQGIYGEPIEYEIQIERVTEVMAELLTINYQGLQKDIAIDLPPIIRYLTIYDIHVNTWKVYLGLRWHDNRWYSPVNDDALITLLYSAITP
ncbi:MAG: hypothetical protein RBS24_04080 [Bacilli bacterium]|nr:hypothetical protein [Bacilli bacterium]